MRNTGPWAKLLGGVCVLSIVLSDAAQFFLDWVLFLHMQVIIRWFWNGVIPEFWVIMLPEISRIVTTVDNSCDLLCLCAS
jgi:hypothetical protein